MKAMKAAELESTGPPLTSRFHQLVGGKSGNGPGSAPLAIGPESAASDSAVLATSGARTRRRAELARTRTGSDFALNILRSLSAAVRAAIAAAKTLRRVAVQKRGRSWCAR